jgi:hypothetical protein
MIKILFSPQAYPATIRNFACEGHLIFFNPTAAAAQAMNLWEEGYAVSGDPSRD